MISIPKDIHAIAAIILAAGDSRRMQRPKALLPLRNTSFLNKIASDYLRLPCDCIIVVVGKDAEQIKAQFGAKKLHFIVNPEPELRPISSLKVGLKALPKDFQAFFMHPVDHPLVTLDTLKAMLAAWLGEPAMAIKPVFEGRGGHPLLLGRNWKEIVLDCPLTASLRELLRANSVNVAPLAVSDPGILQNVNDPADYENLLQASRNS